MNKLNSHLQSIQKDIAFCIDELEFTNEQIGEMLRCCERLGNISAEYFCEEFIFLDEDGGFSDRFHDDEYLNIAEFNAMYWEGN